MVKPRIRHPNANYTESDLIGVDLSYNPGIFNQSFSNTKIYEIYEEDFKDKPRRALEKYVSMYDEDKDSLLDRLSYAFNRERRQRVTAAKLALKDYE